MAKALKIKTDGAVSMGDIPLDVEELELECREIADYAFTKHRLLRRLTLINVERIGERAFGGCRELVSAELLNCKEISNCAFAKNRKLQNITLTNVEIIGDLAFSMCENLEFAELVNCKMSGKNAFKNCYKLRSARLDCKEISESSFCRCGSLRDITLINTEVIGDSAFAGCLLQEIKLPDTLREFKLDDLGSSYGCHLEIPSSFKYAKKLQLQTDGVVSKGDIPDDIEELELECREIAQQAFAKNKSLRLLKLTNVEKISQSAFFGCKNLLALEAVNCKEIEALAFAENKTLLKLALTNVDKICREAFRSCGRLFSAELFNCGFMGISTFEDCRGLHHALLDCKQLDDYCFRGCYELTDVRLINTEVIGRGVFLSCRLSDIQMPETLREIKDEAFDFTHIKRFVIPPSVKKLGSNIIDSTWYDLNFSVLEIYLNKDGTPTFDLDHTHSAPDTILIARSLETGEVLYRFMVIDDLETVLTEHGVDLTEYDKYFFPESYTLSTSFRLDAVTLIEAARMRVHDPVGMSEETLARIKNYVSEKTMNDVKERIDRDNSAKDIGEYPNYDDIGGEHFIELIDFSERKGKPEVTKILVRALYERLDKISDEQLLKVIDHSARNGMTEMTAALMQKLNERRSRG